MTSSGGKTPFTKRYPPFLYLALISSSEVLRVVGCNCARHEELIFPAGDFNEMGGVASSPGRGVEDAETESEIILIQICTLCLEIVCEDDSQLIIIYSCSTLNIYMYQSCRHLLRDTKASSRSLEDIPEMLTLNVVAAVIALISSHNRQTSTLGKIFRVVSECLPFLGCHQREKDLRK